LPFGRLLAAQREDLLDHGAPTPGRSGDHFEIFAPGSSQRH
jgi:hypothetical protein